MRFLITVFVSCLMVQAVLFYSVCSAQEESSEVGIRLANGLPVEGIFKSAAPEGLTVQTAKGIRTLSWKYLSAGTRWRYEKPMLAELEAKRIKAEKEAKAKAEAAAKAAAAKAAEAAKAAVSTTGTNKSALVAGSTNQPKPAGQSPAGVASNKPAAK